MGKVKEVFPYGATMLLSLSVVLAGCSGGTSDPGSGEEGSGTEVGPDNPIEISVFLNEAGQQPTADNKIYKKMKDELGVSFKFEFLAGDKTKSLAL